MQPPYSPLKVSHYLIICSHNTLQLSLTQSQFKFMYLWLFDYIFLPHRIIWTVSLLVTIKFPVYNKVPENKRFDIYSWMLTADFPQDH